MSGSDSKENITETQQQNNNNNNTEDQKQQQQSDFDYNDDTTLPDLVSIRSNYYKTKVNGNILTLEQIKFLENLESSITKKNEKNIEYSNLLRKTGIPLNEDIHTSIESASINGENSKDWNQFVAANQKLRNIYETEIASLRKEKQKNSTYSNNNISQKTNSNNSNSTNNNKKRPTETIVSYAELFDNPNKQQKTDKNQTASNSKKPQDGDVYVNHDSMNDEEPDNTNSWTSFWTRKNQITKDEDRILSEMMNSTKGSKTQYNTIYDVQAKKK